MNGWPDRIQNVPCIAAYFLGSRDELTIEDGILLQGNRIFIPSELYERTFHDLHDNHKAVEKIQHFARAHVYWPGIDVDILDYVRQ